jgi:plasmid stability protein
MAQLVVRNLEEGVKALLQRRARRHGRSTEEEVREILRNAVKNEEVAKEPLGTGLRARFAAIGLQDELPELRGEIARPATFEE